MNEDHLLPYKQSEVVNIDLFAEQYILGGILIDSTSIYRVVDILSAEDFYSTKHQKIYEAILKLTGKSQPVDLVTLINELEISGELEFVGGASNLACMVNDIPTAVNIEHHARLVKDKANLRKLENVFIENFTENQRNKRDLDGIIEKTEGVLVEIGKNRAKSYFLHIKEVVKEGFKNIEKLYEKKELITGIPSGFRELDRRTAGFQPSDFIIVAGRPGMGKTAFCLNCLQYASVEKGISVGIFSMEMSRQQLILRMICSEASVDGSSVRTGYIHKEDWPKLSEAAGKLAGSSVYIDDTPNLSILELKARAKRLKAEHNVEMLIIDYLQLMHGKGKGESRQQEISEISRSLKALARELGIPVITVSQLSRKTEERTGNRPQLSDLRESGAIEQDADLILFLYRDEVYHRSDNNPKKGLAEVIIGKQRNGPIGVIELAFIDKYTSFKDLYRTADTQEHLL